MALAIRLLLVITLLSNSAFAASEITINWVMDGSTAGIAGFRLAYGTDKANLDNTIDMGLPVAVDGVFTYTGEFVSDEKHYYKCIPYDSGGTDMTGSSAYVAKASRYNALISGEGNIILSGPAAADILN